jgi:hypothetical protein
MIGGLRDRKENGERSGFTEERILMPSDSVLLCWLS